MLGFDRDRLLVEERVAALLDAAATTRRTPASAVVAVPDAWRGRHVPVVRPFGLASLR